MEMEFDIEAGILFNIPLSKNEWRWKAQVIKVCLDSNPYEWFYLELAAVIHYKKTGQRSWPKVPAAVATGTNATHQYRLQKQLVPLASGDQR